MKCPKCYKEMISASIACSCGFTFKGNPLWAVSPVSEPILSEITGSFQTHTPKKLPGWGPARPTYTNQNPAHHAVFNSITDTIQTEVAQIEQNKEITYPNGDKYIGDIKMDKRHGIGTLYYASGKICEGVWLNDTFSEKLSEFYREAWQMNVYDRLYIEWTTVFGLEEEDYPRTIRAVREKIEKEFIEAKRNRKSKQFWGDVIRDWLNGTGKYIPSELKYNGR